MLSPRNSWKRAKVQGKVKLAICTWLGPGTPSLLLLPWPSQSQAKPRLQGLENWLMARNWGHNGKKAKWNMADSRAVQWWRLCASNLGDMASIPGQGTKIPHAQSQNIKKKKKKRKKETWILSRSYPGHLSFILGLFVPESLFSTPHRPPSGYSNLIRAPPSTILVFLSPGQLQAEGLKQLKPSIDFSFSPQLLSFLKFPNVFRELWEANYTCDLISQETWHYLQTKKWMPERLSNLARDP